MIRVEQIIVLGHVWGHRQVVIIQKSNRMGGSIVKIYLQILYDVVYYDPATIIHEKFGYFFFFFASNFLKIWVVFHY